MGDLKVLPLPAWLPTSLKWSVMWNKPQDYVEDASFPVYSDGWYYDRKKKVSWYCHQGKTYVSAHHPNPNERFLEDLEFASIRVLRECEAKALETLIVSGFPLPKEVVKAYNDFRFWQDLNSFASRHYRGLKKSVRDSKKRFAAFKAQIAVDKKTDGS